MPYAVKTLSQRKPRAKEVRGPRKYDKAAWKRVSRYYRTKEPLCEVCIKNGITIEADLVHHIIEVKDGGSDYDENLMSLCSYCHNQIHKTTLNCGHGRGGINC